MGQTRQDRNYYDIDASNSLSIAISQIPARAFAAANVDRGGYEMRVHLDRAFSIMSSRVGDRFTATVADPGPFNLATACFDRNLGAAAGHQCPRLSRNSTNLSWNYVNPQCPTRSAL